MKHTTKLLVLAAGLVGGVGIATTGWAYWSAHGSGTASATVGTWKTDTTATVVSSANPSLVGQQVTYTATVSASGSGSPTGNVQFLAGATPISTCGGSSGTPLSGSNATCVQTYPAVGGHTITAKYLGDGNFNASPLSAAVTQVVNQGSTTTSLTVTGSPVTYGLENTVVFSAAVTAPATPTGTVAVKQGATTLCSIALPATTCSPSTTALSASPTAYSIIAVYSGNASLLGSTSSAQNLTVNKATPIISWPSPADITYGTALSGTQLNASANTAGTFTYNPPDGTILNVGSPALNVTFGPADTTNWETAIAGVASLNVTKAPLTITASSDTMTYGGTVPTITPSYSGFVNSQNSTVLTSQPTCSNTATTTSAAGSSQTSSCTGAAAANYSFTYVGGTVTVNKAALTVTASSASMTYGGTPPTITPSYAGFVNGQTTAALSAQPTCTTTATTTSGAGSSQTSSCAGATAANYSFTYVGGTVTVNKASQSISFTAPASGTVGATAALTATGGGSGNPVVFTIDDSSDAGVCSVTGVNGTTVTYGAVGTCVINANQAGNGNYDAAIQVQRSVPVAKLTITSAARSSGSRKYTFSGTGASGSLPVTVTICTQNVFPCADSNPPTATASSPGITWTTAQDSANLGNDVQYWVQAAQGGATSAVFHFYSTNTTPAVIPAGVTVSNIGGVPGKADANDTLTVTFGQPLDATTFCSTWTNSGVQTASASVQIVDSVNNDRLDNLTVAGCTFRFGSVTLGANYVSGTVTFSSSTVSWDPSTGKFTITLGGGTGQNTVAANSIPQYTANTAIKDQAGVAITAGPWSGTSSRF